MICWLPDLRGAGRGLVCRFTMFSFSTTMRRSAGTTRSTVPRLPASLPVSTCTESPFLILILVATSEHLGSEGDDLHEVALAQLSGHGAEDARAARVSVLVDDDGRVLVEGDVRAVVAVVLLARAHHHGRHDLALAHRPVGRGLLDGADDDIAHPRIPAAAAALDADAQEHARAGVVGNSQARLHLDHLATSTISATRQRLVFDSGRVSTSRTTSPTLEVFSWSWACRRIERRIVFLYFGCGFSTSTRTTTVLSMASDTTTPRRSLRTPRDRASAVCPVSVLMPHVLRGPTRWRASGAARCRASRAPGRPCCRALRSHAGTAG